MNALFVYCEINNTKVCDVSLQLLTKGRTLATALQVSLEAILIGTNIGDETTREILSYGVDTLHVYDHALLSPYTTAPYAAIVTKLLQREQPQICLLGATAVGRDLAPRVSSALRCGLTADCTALEIGPYDDKRTGRHYGQLLYQIRPAFGGNIVATIVNPDHRPQMATVRTGVMKAEPLDRPHEGKVVYEDVNKLVSPEECLVKVIERHVTPIESHLKDAAIVVAGGYGVGSKEGFEQLQQLATLLHGEVGATRAAVDAGYCPAHLQIGQTGLTVHPKVYFACGISGAIQHVEGMKDSGIVIAINTDPQAPINQLADYVITGKVEDVVPKLIKYYKQNVK